MPRFVILEHDHPVRHWDLMLETGSILRTWRLAEPPRPGSVITAEATFDHRLHYLDYEGPVSGDRGTVTRWLAGTYEILREAVDRVEISYRTGEAVARMTILGVADNRWTVEVYE